MQEESIANHEARTFVHHMKKKTSFGSSFQYQGATSIVLLLLSLCSNLQAQCISGDCKNGKGIYLYPSGAKYIGHFVNGECSGIGVCYYADGSKYQGNWAKRFPEGHGIKTYTDGTVRNGYWKQGKPVDEKGNIMEEVFKQKEIFNDGTDIQSGCLSGDCKTGIGVLAYVDGSRYEGEFINGKIQGEGSFEYPNGDKYIGMFRNNLPDGKGIKIKADGSKLSGNWAVGEYRGKEMEASEKIGCIYGNCKDGQGTYVFPEAIATYTGGFVNSQCEGKGTIKYANGDTYTGGFRLGKLNGEGTLILKDKTIIKGEWQDGEFLRSITYDPEPEVLTNVEPQAIQKKVKTWALVVGVSQYDRMPVLRYADDDAYKMFAYLKSSEGGGIPDERIRVLVDEDATKQQIKQNMKELFSQAGPDDLVIFYFAGHGLKGSFLPIDFDGYNYKLTHEELNAIMDESPAGMKLYIADACHSGSAANDFKGNPDAMAENFYGSFNDMSTEKAILMSSKSEETSLESKGLRQGVFTYFLIKGLKGLADANEDKVVNLTELYDYVKANVSSYTGNKQTPVVIGQFDEKMVLSNLK